MKRIRGEYILMGVQGSGKGTQAKMLVDDYDLVHISTGDLFRWHINNHTKLGTRIQRGMTRGILVSDDVVNQVVSARLAEHDWNYGFLLDGYPRTVPQAEYLLESFNVDAVIFLDVPDEVVVGRIAARRVCAKCHAIYSFPSRMPASSGICDRCGGPVLQREDDNEEAVKRRISDFRAAIDPMLRLFEEVDMVRRIDANQPIPEVAKAIRERLDFGPATVQRKSDQK